MYSYSKDGITVVSMLDTRKINANQKYPVKIRVNYRRVRAYFSIGIDLTEEEWLRLPTNKSTLGKHVRENIENSFSLVKNNVEALAEKGNFTIDTLKCRLGKATGDTVNNAFRAKIDMLDTDDRIGSMQLNQNTLKLLEDFAGPNITFDMITVQWLHKCEKFWLLSKNQTTVGMHFRNLRAILNDARKAGVIKEAQYPFGKDRFEIKTGEAHKKALTIQNIALLYQYSDGLLTTEKYRDLWMFSFFCNGINIADLIKLKYSNIIDDEIVFIRQKTELTTKCRKEIRVVITPELDSIIKRWGNPIDNNNYIFPYLNGKETALQRKNITKDLTHRINKRMNKVGHILNIGNISTYTARHSFATTLKRGGANIAYISESLGHSDLKTTATYLASFEKEERAKNALLLTNFL